MKKRILMILTAVSLMAAGLTGCAASETKETQAPASETSAETVRESDGETSEEKAAETGYEAGVTSETSWSSEWLNMKFIPGEGVTLLSEEEKEMVLPLILSRPALTDSVCLMLFSLKSFSQPSLWPETIKAVKLSRPLPSALPPVLLWQLFFIPPPAFPLPAA